MPTGFINLLKPPGLTSSQAVGVARRRLGERQIGHTGTLDPLAAGVLPLAVGWATRLIPYLPTTATDKTYVAEAWLGQTTDTQDSSGRILAEAPVPHFSAEDVARHLMGMVGHQEQVPPMASALHHEGRRLYDLFRAGIEVDRPARPVYIESLELLRWDTPRLLFRVVCSGGTYVRTLCHDLGLRLGCGACMHFLVRTRSSVFDIADAILLEDVGPASLIDASQPLSGIPAMCLTPEQQKDVSHGRCIEGTPDPPARLCGPGCPPPDGSTVRLIDAAGHLLAMARRTEDGQWHPTCVAP